MLQTLHDLRRYTEERATKYPKRAGEILIEASESTLRPEVVALLNLPPIYRAVVESNRITGVSIGFFNLSPGPRGLPLEADLLASNEPGALISRLNKSDLVAVAAEESNPICVASAGSPNQDRVFLVEVMVSPEWRVRPIADNFKTFILLAANLHQISVAYEESPTEGLSEMDRCCVEFGCTEEQRQFWQERAGVMLS